MACITVLDFMTIFKAVVVTSNDDVDRLTNSVASMYLQHLPFDKTPNLHDEWVVQP